MGAARREAAARVDVERETGEGEQQDAVEPGGAQADEHGRDHRERGDEQIDGSEDAAVPRHRGEDHRMGSRSVVATATARVEQRRSHRGLPTITRTPRSAIVRGRRNTGSRIMSINNHGSVKRGEQDAELDEEATAHAHVAVTAEGAVWQQAIEPGPGTAADGLDIRQILRQASAMIARIVRRAPAKIAAEGGMSSS